MPHATATGGPQYANRPHIGKTKRAALLARAGGLCLYCQWYAATTLDHFEPLSSWKPGVRRLCNLVPACDRCNRHKRAMPPVRFIFTCCQPETLQRVLDFLRESQRLEAAG